MIDTPAAAATAPKLGRVLEGGTEGDKARASRLDELLLRYCVASFAAPVYHAGTREC